MSNLAAVHADDVSAKDDTAIFRAATEVLTRYFATTAFVAEPPALLVAVMVCGFTGQLS